MFTYIISDTIRLVNSKQLIRRSEHEVKQDVGKKRAVTQKSKDEVAGGPALVFKFLDCNYDEDGNVKSVKQLVHNFEVVMDKDSRFGGKIRLNEFAQQPYLYGSVP